MPVPREIRISRERSNASSSHTKSDSLPFDFRSQVEFIAAQDLLRSRSECYLESKRARDKRIIEQELKRRTAWDIDPPDFTLQLCKPKPPKRNSRSAMLPGYNEDKWIKIVREKQRHRVQFEHIPLPKILQGPASDHRPFTTQFRVPDSHAAKILFVKNGVHKRESYTTPGPHAFRGDDFRPTKETQRDTISTVTSGSTFDSMYEIALFQLDNPKKYGLPEFVTSCEHDPGNLKFHSRKLNVLRDSYKDQEFLNSKDGYRKQMITYREQDQSWKPSLILPKGPYRRGRSPKSALMDRIAEQLPWCPDNNRMEELGRPDIFDNTTVDWIKVTAYNKAEINIV